VSLLVWLAFGAVAVVPAVENLNWQIALYAVLSLTLIRMLPVAVALAGSGQGWRTTAFVGWFGPRGLASVVFALLALEELGGKATTAVTVISTTVLLSVIAHGITAEPLARRYAAALSRTAASPAHAGRPELPPRKLTRRHRASSPAAIPPGPVGGPPG
jgi:sodium/hydrogen antiporter